MKHLCSTWTAAVSYIFVIHSCSFVVEHHPDVSCMVTHVVVVGKVKQCLALMFIQLYL